MAQLKYRSDVSAPEAGDDRPALSMEDMCRDILARHQDTISVRNPSIAVPRLKRILVAALDLSNSGGFQAMSLRDLSEESGMSTGGLYAYFDSKTTLLRMILAQVTHVVETVLTAPPPGITDDAVAHLQWMIDAHLRLTEDLLAWFVFAFMEAKSFPPAERRLAIESEALTEALFADIIKKGIAKGQFRSETSELLPALIKPLLQDWYVKRAKYRRRRISLDAYSATVKDIILRYCVPNAGDF